METRTPLQARQCPSSNVEHERTGSAWQFLPIPPRMSRRSPARLVGFGKRGLPAGCTMASMMPTARPARERRRRRVRNADELEPRRGPSGDPSAPSATGASPSDLSLAAPGALALRRMANLIARYAPHDGVFPLRLPGTYALRRARMTSEPVHATLGPSLCIVAQGAKIVMLGREVLEYDPARMLVFAVDLPVSGQLTRASRRGSVSRLQAGSGSAARGRTRREGLPTGRPQALGQSRALCRTRDRRHHRRRDALAGSDGPARGCGPPRTARRRRDPDSVCYARRLVRVSPRSESRNPASTGLPKPCPGYARISRNPSRLRRWPPRST